MQFHIVLDDQTIAVFQRTLPECCLQWKMLSGSRNGMVVRTPIARIQLRPGVIRGLSLFLVLALLRGFFSGFSGFPPYTKINNSKFKFDHDRGPAWKPAKADVVSSLNIVIYRNKMQNSQLAVFICSFSTKTKGPVRLTNFLWQINM